jgi:glutathione synthase/RimK-type ligase-like ATP-grasp enzyme
MEYVTDKRVLVEAARLAAANVGGSYEDFSNGWVGRLQKGDKTAFILGYYIDCNTQAASMIAIDKVATYLLLQDAGVAAVPHYLVRSDAMSDFDTDGLRRLFAEYHELVLKPLKGHRGKSVALYIDADTAINTILAHAEHAWAASPYIAIQREVRVVVFEGSAVLAYEKTNPQQTDGLKMFNLEHGAIPQDVPLETMPEEWRTMVCTAMKAIGLTLGAVDIVIDDRGKARVLEINSGFSLEHYAKTSPQRRQQVLDMYLKVFTSMIV